MFGVSVADLGPFAPLLGACSWPARARNMRAGPWACECVHNCVSHGCRPKVQEWSTGTRTRVYVRAQSMRRQLLAMIHGDHKSVTGRRSMDSSQVKHAMEGAPGAVAPRLVRGIRQATLSYWVHGYNMGTFGYIVPPPNGYIKVHTPKGCTLYPVSPVLKLVPGGRPVDQHPRPCALLPVGPSLSLLHWLGSRHPRFRKRSRQSRTRLGGHSFEPP